MCQTYYFLFIIIDAKLTKLIRTLTCKLESHLCAACSKPERRITYNPRLKRERKKTYFSIRKVIKLFQLHFTIKKFFKKNALNFSYNNDSLYNVISYQYYIK
jgi:hypothetical protein